ncbi:MAG: [FeFe] hydrogenase H-cluster radical SAM maturase HydE [bacterium]|nr:[FeFe] hydrogenase H-cluster radical SAM maturase HydE [bacterium]
MKQKWSQEELTCLLAQSDEAFLPVLEAANRVCEANFGKEVKVRALLEFSNHCKRQCRYCGLNCRNRKLARFRMEPEQIVETAVEAADCGYQTIVLQSGEDSFYSVEMLGELVKAIKAARPKLAVTLSCGEFKAADYRYFKECGADRYLLKHETSDETLYQELHPDSDFGQRLACQKAIKAAGLETGGGFMIGLPHQTLAGIAKDLLTVASIPCDMAGVGPFLPHPDTELGNEPHGSATLTIRAVALLRLLLPKANLPATTALGVLDAAQKDKIFCCGANVIMQKVTPSDYKKLYQIYPAEFKSLSITEGRRQVEEEIRRLGRIPV